MGTSSQKGGSIVRKVLHDISEQGSKNARNRSKVIYLARGREPLAETRNDHNPTFCWHEAPFLYLVPQNYGWSNLAIE
jgi:hypothetical protein